MIAGEVREMDNRSASGLRRSPFKELSSEEIELLKSEIRAIGADESVFRLTKAQGLRFLIGQETST